MLNKSYPWLTTGLCAMIFVFSQHLHAQQYLRGFGLRVGGYQGYEGLSYKEFVTPSLALELVAGKNSGTLKNTSLQLMVEHHTSIGHGGLQWYLGAGPAALYWYESVRDYHRETIRVDQAGRFRLMVNAVTGFEFPIARWPIHVALDLGPSVYVYPHPQVSLMLNATVRYSVLNHQFRAHHNFGKRAYTGGRRSSGGRYW